MPRRSPTSSFEHPAAISSITSTCRAVNLGKEARSASYMQRSYFPRTARAIDQKEYFAGLRRYLPAAHEARVVPAAVRFRELVLVQRTDPQQQVELVSEVSAH